MKKDFQVARVEKGDKGLIALILRDLFFLFLFSQVMIHH